MALYVFLLVRDYCYLPRFISDKNQVRRSVSSIQTSIRLAVATVAMLVAYVVRFAQAGR
jgi:hypothetical protein